MLSPADVEIQWVAQDNIYDLYVNGRFRNFYKTFDEAALDAERIIAESSDPFRNWKGLPPRKGKVRRR